MKGIVQQELTDRILGLAFTVHQYLGPGLLEVLYEEAFCVALSRAGVPFERQKRFPVSFMCVPIGEYVADLVVDGKVLLELKAVKRFSEAMEAQIINYLKLSKIRVGYLINFHGVSLEWKRYVEGSG